MARVKSMKRKNKIINTVIYVVLALLSVIWLTPIAYIVYISFSPQDSQAALSQFPGLGDLTLRHYINILNPDYQPYIQWFLNTLMVALVTMVINTFFIMAVAYTMSRLKFKGRKNLMLVNLILGMFPGFMSMIAIYNLLKLVGLIENAPLFGLILCYTMTSGMGFYVAKGFFDTISKSLDEAARIDGATNAQIFFQIILPLSKPIIVYTLVQSFMGPWMDFIFCKVILRENVDSYTVALGMNSWLSDTGGKKGQHFVDFFAGSVLISIPIMAVFLSTQKYYVAGVTGGAVKG